MAKGNQRTTYSDDTKSAAMAALLAGQSVSEVAAAYKIPEGTVRSWCTRVRAAEIRPEIGELLVVYLRENLVTLAQQQAVFRDVAWLKEQGASELAVLHGVLTDKAIRLLEALGNASAPSTTDDGEAADARA